MTKHDSKINDDLIISLKSGEYDGTHIIKAWITIEEQEQELVELRKKNAELEKMLIKLVDDDCNEWYRLEILNLLN